MVTLHIIHPGLSAQVPSPVFPQTHTQMHGLTTPGSDQMNIFKLASMNFILFW